MIPLNPAESARARFAQYRHERLELVRFRADREGPWGEAVGLPLLLDICWGLLLYLRWEPRSEILTNTLRELGLFLRRGPGRWGTRSVHHLYMRMKFQTATAKLLGNRLERLSASDFKKRAVSDPPPPNFDLDLRTLSAVCLMARGLQRVPEKSEVLSAFADTFCQLPLYTDPERRARVPFFKAHVEMFLTQYGYFLDEWDRRELIRWVNQRFGGPASPPWEVF